MTTASAVECWGCGRIVESPTLDQLGYVTCPECALRFYPSGEAPRDQYNSDYFESYSGEGYHVEAQRRYESQKRLAMVRSHCPGAHDLLEIGSAGGYFLDEARKAGFAPVGVEPVESVAARARTELGVNVIVGWAEEVELPPASFDVACMWHTLEHIPAPIGVLRTVHGALRPGGKLLLEVPNGASLLAQRKAARWWALAPEVHVGQWTPAAIGALLERAGFTVESVTTVSLLVYIARWWGRLPRRVLQAVRQRRVLADSHPSGHDLLQAVGVADAAPGGH